MEAEVKALQMGKSAGVDNIPAEFVKAGGDTMTDILNYLQQDIENRRMANRLDKPLVIILPKKGNLQMCQKLQNHQPV